MATIRILALLARRSGRRTLGTFALTGAGVAVASLLLLLVAASLPALDGRADRMAWRDPQKASDGEASALQVRSTEIFAGRPIDRVDLALAAGTDPGPAPHPPGLRQFPNAGEVWVSPAMARLLTATADDRLDRRFPGAVAGRIAPDGLAHEDELVVVVGRQSADLLAERPDHASDDGRPGARGVVTEVSGFATSGRDHRLDGYRTLAQLAGVLVAMPALLLIGSAARLAAAQRHQRLAALRLAGATPHAVVLLTAAETAAAALVGALVAIVGYAAVLGPMAHIPLAGGPWERSQLWLGLPTLALVLAAVPVVAALCAVAGLRQVTISPLGVSRRVRPAGLRAVRWLVAVVAWVMFAVTVSRSGPGVGVGAVFLALGAIIGSFAVVGPWMTWILGVVLARLARRPPLLLAARRITDDPKGAYRAVSGVVLAGLVCGFLLVAMPVVDDGGDGEASDPVLTAVVPRDGHQERLAAVRARITPIAPAAVVDIEDDEDTLVVISVRPGREADVDRIRTAVSDVLPFQPLETAGNDGSVTEQLMEDIGRGSTVVTIATLLLATVATAIGAIAAVLDQRVTLTRLRLAGAPLEVLQRARRWQAALPLAVATIVSVGSGAVASLVLTELVFDVDPGRPDALTVISLGGIVLVGCLAGVLCAEGTRPLLERSTRPDPKGASR
jgi:cell division protein FtsX